MNRWLGPALTALIVGAVGLILYLNLEAPHRASPGRAPAPEAKKPSAPAKAADFREYPIGEEVVRPAEHLRIAAVWLPGVHTQGMPAARPDTIHLEADVKATEANPNGFAADEFIPYLRISYEIEPAGGGPKVSGDLVPMVARDGLHYGANILAPPPGKYRLTYRVQPPSAGGLGRHDDPNTGVAAWWEPFEATFDWDHRPAPGG